MPEGAHKDLLTEALREEAAGQQALLDGDADAASEPLRRAVQRYRESWEAAPPASFGRLVGMLKAAVLAGGAVEEARYARAAISDPGASPAAHYALAIAALVLAEDDAAARAAEGMRTGSPAFVRAADAIAAIATGDGAAYAKAVRAIVDDFEGRDEHLTGVAIADTALMLERLAEARGLACAPRSQLLP